MVSKGRHPFEFTVYLDRQPTDDELDLLYEAGFDDSMPEVGHGRGLIHVCREAETLADAITSTISNAATAGFSVVAIEDEDLVGLRTIATRLGYTDAYVRMLASGKRGPGGFPVATSGDGWSLHSWTEVARWARENLDANLPAEDDRSRILALADHLLRARALAVGADAPLLRALVPA